MPDCKFRNRSAATAAAVGAAAINPDVNGQAAGPGTGTGRDGLHNLERFVRQDKVDEFHLQTTLLCISCNA